MIRDKLSYKECALPHLKIAMIYLGRKQLLIKQKELPHLKDFS